MPNFTAKFIFFQIYLNSGKFHEIQLSFIGYFNLKKTDLLIKVSFIFCLVMTHLDYNLDLRLRLSSKKKYSDIEIKSGFLMKNLKTKKHP